MRRGSTGHVQQGSPGGLPAQLGRLVDRDDAVVRIAELLRGNRLVTLVGPGGCGKTSLALAATHSFTGEFADGARWVDLGPVSDPALVEEVFRFQADEHYRNHPRWDPAVTKLQPLGDGPIRLGSRFELTRRMMGREETNTFEVVEWDAPRTFVIATGSPGFSLRIAAECASAGDGRTRLTVSGDAQMGGIRGFLAPLMRGKLTRDTQANVDRVKQMVQEES